MSKKTKIIRGGSNNVYEELVALPVGTPIRVQIPGLDWIDTVLERVGDEYSHLRKASIAGQSVLISDKVYNYNWQVEIPVPPVVPEDGVYAYDNPEGPNPFGAVYKYRNGSWRNGEGYKVNYPQTAQSDFEAGRLKKLRF